MIKTPAIGLAMFATLVLSTLTAIAAPTVIERPAIASVYELAQGNCNAAAQRVVAETGGQLLSVTPGPDGTCSVTVLVPGKGDEPRRKLTRTVQG